MADGERWFSGCLQHIQNSGGPAKEAESEAGSGAWLTGTIVGSEEVAGFIEGSAEQARRSWALEPAHRTITCFDTTVVLLQPIVQITTVAMPHACPQDRADRSRIAVMAIGRDARWRDAGDHLGRCEERLCGRHVAVLTEHHVDQRTGAIDGAVEVAPLPMNLDVRFVDIPATAGLAAPAPP